MHKSVLLDECLNNLNLKEDSVIIDATLGYAGHSSEILKRIKKGFLFAFDQDNDAIKSSSERLNKINDNYEIIKSNFVYITEELNKRNIKEVDGILFDLGVSSPQLDEKERGFSFHQDAPLDMRMDQNQSLSAYEVVNNYSQNEIIKILRDFGEERFASSIARGIVKARSEKEIKTTLELVEVIKNNVPEKYRRDKHPARKSFQAIRIEVNKELEVCNSAVKQALELIKVGGRVCVITFHSLEDKIVKSIFKECSELDKNLRTLPVVPEEYLPKFKMIANIAPSNSELEENSRSRSARLRVIEKVR